MQNPFKAFFFLYDNFLSVEEHFYYYSICFFYLEKRYYLNGDNLIATTICHSIGPINYTKTQLRQNAFHLKKKKNKTANDANHFFVVFGTEQYKPHNFTYNSNKYYEENKFVDQHHNKHIHIDITFMKYSVGYTIMKT